MFVDLNKKRAISAISGDMISANDLREIFSEIRDEFEDHLTAINENTGEIQANYEALSELDSKIDRLGERLDKIELFLKGEGFKADEEPKFNIPKLTKNEQEAFLILYTHEEKGPISYEELARKLCLTEELAASYVQSLVAKGVPIHKRYITNRAFVRLDKNFKHLQTKKNILKISQTIIPNILSNQD